MLANSAYREAELRHWKLHPELPVFLIERENGDFLWAEGLYIALKTSEASSETKQELARQALRLPAAEPLIRAARHALNRWRQMHRGIFRPFCLTIIPNHDCNLHCSYCYNAPAAQNRDRIDMDAVRAAALRVSSVCREDRETFVLVVTGGGEPTLHWELLQAAVHEVEGVANDQGVRKFTRLVTNATLLDTDKCGWLARHFDLVCVSCDGHPDFPYPGQKPDSKQQSIVFQACADIRAQGGTVEVRTTLRPDDFGRQDQIVAHLIQATGCVRVNLEPIYGAPELNTDPDDLARNFVDGFLRARRLAARSRIPLVYSGMRPQEVHASYCDPFRSTLRLFPQNSANICFLGKAGAPFQIEATESRLLERLGNSFQTVALSGECAACLAQLHCSRGCPDFCTPEGGDTGHARFRCAINRLLYEDYLRERLSG